MLRGPLYEDGYRPQLSGHETFPLRYGWLKKAYDAVRKSEGQANSGEVFSGPDAIARFGVGKNMVTSMRYWAEAAGVVAVDSRANHAATTSFGRRLFEDHGLDPYMEDPITSWLIHWHLAGRPKKTTWFWAFSHYPALTFEREGMVEAISRLAKDRKWPRASSTTIKNDVACFVRTYVVQSPAAKSTQEDSLESPLTELGLIKPIGRRGGFRFVRGAKPSLGVEAFCYAVTDFWNDRFPDVNTLSLEVLTHEPGSPGHVFLLDENDVVDMLVQMEDRTNGAYRWSETAGLKQLMRDRQLDHEWAMGQVAKSFAPTRQRDAA